jgi:hypothetical protein
LASGAPMRRELCEAGRHRGAGTRCGGVPPLPSAAMRIEIDPPELVEDLLETLRRAGCPAKAIAHDLIEVGSPAPFLTDEQARREVGLYLAVWSLRHRDARARVVCDALNGPG